MKTLSEQREEIRARHIANRMERCRHYSYELGLRWRGPLCAIGLTILRGPGEPRPPCVGGAAPCEGFSPFTRAEAEAHADEMDALVARLIKNLDEGRCPTCEATVERQRQVGRCIYAEPCGHRLGQGKAK